ncbi:hypothetical protein A3860_15805 [Niastella vici]|uniref:Histidine kinase N-terminal 7TM region domain-containing protein n=1 Tax=Niastella vici TaxID=1703345 RepID=A0A1V9G5X5_9BACT|nr:hypothetical protein [Niastella vici]OQP66049.1 hypothetical protein A3860_15805 [Niastella vici]
MSKYVFDAYLVLLLIGTFTGFYYTRGLNRTFLPLKLLPWFLLLTFINEILAMTWPKRLGGNYFIYNIYLIFQFCFYSYMLVQMIENRRMKQLLTCLAIAYSIFATLNIGVIQGMHTFNTLNYFTGAVILSFFSGYSLNEQFKKDIACNPFKKPYFWIASSILVLETAMVPLLLPPYFDLHLSKVELRLISILLNLINLIVYSMFIVAFRYLYKNSVRSSLQR